jgi:hypothetical protein
MPTFHPSRLLGSGTFGQVFACQVFACREQDDRGVVVSDGDLAVGATVRRGMRRG